MGSEAVQQAGLVEAAVEPQAEDLRVQGLCQSPLAPMAEREAGAGSCAARSSSSLLLFMHIYEQAHWRAPLQWRGAYLELLGSGASWVSQGRLDQGAAAHDVRIQEAHEVGEQHGPDAFRRHHDRGTRQVKDLHISAYVGSRALAAPMVSQCPRANRLMLPIGL